MDHDEFDTLVRSHHDALAAWLTRGDDEQLARFLAAHDDRFTLVTVGGDRLENDGLRAALAGAGGAQPALQLEVDDIHVVFVSAGLSVVRFRETHRIAHGSDQTTQRVTTAVLRRHGSDWRWLTVHETAVQPLPET